ncbi:hypothetical protein QJQ45_008335 [Haematococcus lacustris]|nr:hypothetical protein QJQ45_008335 [Haematococcus lacustris]
MPRRLPDMCCTGGALNDGIKTIAGMVGFEEAQPPRDAHQPWVQQVGKHPKTYIFHNFLTDEERVHMLTLAAPEMKRSTVVGGAGAGVVDDIRTSYGMFIQRLHDPIIERIENRVSLFTQLPVSHQEDIQVLRYQAGQKYGAHYDSSYADKGPGPKWRMATFLIYLSDVEEGGETAFPQGSEWEDHSIPARLEAAGVQFSDCAKGHVAAKPKAGDATLFYSYHPNGTMDTASMHTGCPVIKGIKWAAPIWIHVDEFNPPLTRPAKQSMAASNPGVCEDLDDRCAGWAASGECTANPGFMVGANTSSLGMCRLACQVCQPCDSDDWDCINSNRRKGGFLELNKEEMEWLGVKWLGREPSPEL